MRKRTGVLALILAGAATLLPSAASAQERYYGSGYYQQHANRDWHDRGDRDHRDRDDWRTDRRWSNHEWREQERREHEWRKRQRWENQYAPGYSYYDSNGYYWPR